MELYQFLYENKITEKEMAEILSVQPRMVNRIKAKMGSPSLKTAVSIVDLTGGLVSFEELLSKADVQLLKDKGLR